MPVTSSVGKRPEGVLLLFEARFDRFFNALARNQEEFKHLPATPCASIPAHKIGSPALPYLYLRRGCPASHDAGGARVGAALAPGTACGHSPMVAVAAKACATCRFAYIRDRHSPQTNGMTYIDAAVAPLRKTGQIKIYGDNAFAAMRKAGRLVAECLDMLGPEIAPGAPTSRIDQLVFEFAMDHGALPATLMYRGYTKSTCTSVNHVVCHGIPNEKPLKDGDIVNVDVTLIVDGWHGDSSRMYGVGTIPRRAERLIEVTYEAMMRGIAAIRPGGTAGDIGEAIETFVKQHNMSVVRDFCGHGLGRLFHDEPNIVHVGRSGEGITLKPGMLFTVEPMINLGRPHVKVLSDGWTAVTRDRSLSAQFEHTVGVTETGVEIFTLSPKGLDKPHYESA